MGRPDDEITIRICERVCAVGQLFCCYKTGSVGIASGWRRALGGLR